MSVAVNQARGANVVSPYTLSQSGVPAILVPNGTVATNGTITLGTALPTTYSVGAWIRLPAGAIVSGSAGLYWCVFSSTTVGQVYTNFSDPASQFIPTVPSGTLTAAVGSNAAYTQATAADVTLVNVTIPAGALGLYGQARLNYEFSYNLAAGNKIFTRKLGGVSMQSSTRTTSGGHDSITDRLRAKGAQNRNTYYAASESSATNSAAAGINTIDLSAAQAYTLTGQLDAATNYILVDSFCFEILPS